MSEPGETDLETGRMSSNVPTRLSPDPSTGVPFSFSAPVSLCSAESRDRIAVAGSVYLPALQPAGRS